MDSLGKMLLKSPIIRRALPAELMNELFGSLPLENAFGLLDKMANGLLARNVQKMINCIKEAMKNNKWNEADCSPNMIISEDGLIVTHMGQHEKRKCTRAILPIPVINLHIIKPTISFYFELQIHKKDWPDPIIGFCTQHFPLEGPWHGFEQIPSLGSEENSLGICYHSGMKIDDSWTIIGDSNQPFRNADVIGIGIIYFPSNSSMKCFATLNGELLGMAELPAKFAYIKLYPAFNLTINGNSIHANFGKEEWRFKKFHQLFQ